MPESGDTAGFGLQTAEGYGPPPGRLAGLQPDFDGLLVQIKRRQGPGSYGVGGGRTNLFRAARLAAGSTGWGVF